MKNITFKKIVVNLISLVIGYFAWITSAAGAMEYFEDKNYFGMGETIALVIVLLFSLFVFISCFYCLKMFLYESLDKDEKK